MKKLSKILSIFLCLAMLISFVSMVPTHVHAVDGSKWTKVELANIHATDTIAITMTKGSDTWALTSNNGTNSAPTAVAVTVEGTTMTAFSGNISWNISNLNGSLTIYPAGTTEKWLYSTNANNGVRVGDNANSVWSIDTNSGYLKNNATSRYLGVYNSQDWRAYTNTTGNTAGQTLSFWKYVGVAAACTHEDTTLKFNAYQHWNACSCGEILNAESHKSTWDCCDAMKYETSLTNGTPYNLAMYSTNKSDYYYFTGQLSSDSLSASTDRSKAVEVFIEDATGGKYIYFLKDEVKTYIDIYVDAEDENKVKCRLVTTPGVVFEWVETYSTFKTTIGAKEYFLCTYNTGTSITDTEIRYLTDDNVMAPTGKNYPALFYALPECEHENTKLVHDNYQHWTVCLNEECGMIVIPAGSTDTDGKFDHTFSPDTGICTEANCGVKALPADGSTLTIPEAIAVGNRFEWNSYTNEKYTITGVIDEVINTEYGNMYIKDSNGNRILVFGLYQGETRYDAMTTKPIKGDTITVSTVLGKYDEAQAKNAQLTSHAAHTCDWQWKTDADNHHFQKCSICGNTTTPCTGTTATAWSNDNTNHWHACTDEACTYTVDKAAHAPVAGYTSGTNGHYQTCSCGFKYDEVAHTKGDDGKCTACGEDLNCAHVTDSTQWEKKSDATNHWEECKICHSKRNEAKHPAVADDGNCTTAVVCPDCGWVITAAKTAHTPNADDGDCTTAITCKDCGTVTTEAKTAHNYGTDNKCTVCGKEKPAETADVTFDFSDLEVGNEITDNALDVFQNATESDVAFGVTLNKVYAGSTSGGALEKMPGYLKLGTSKAQGQITLTFGEGSKVTKVEIYCHDWYKKSDAYPTNSNYVSVNGSDKVLAPYNETGACEVLTFDLTDGSNKVTIDTDKRIFISKIVVTGTFADGGSQTPDDTQNAYDTLPASVT